MKRSSTLFTCMLAGSCLLATTDTRALTTTQMAVLGGLIGSTYLLYAREIKKDVTPRYNVKKIGEVRNVFTKSYAKNLWYLFYDGLIGQRGKGSTKPFGLLATAEYHVAPLKKAGGMVAFGYMLYRAKFKLEKHVANLAKHKEDKSVAE